MIKSLLYKFLRKDIINKLKKYQSIEATNVVLKSFGLKEISFESEIDKIINKLAEKKKI